MENQILTIKLFKIIYRGKDSFNFRKTKMKLNSLLLSGFAFVNGADELPKMIDYQQLYLPDPKIVMGGEPPKGKVKDYISTVFIVNQRFCGK